MSEKGHIVEQDVLWISWNRTDSRSWWAFGCEIVAPTMRKPLRAHRYILHHARRNHYRFFNCAITSISVFERLSLSSLQWDDDLRVNPAIDSSMPPIERLALYFMGRWILLGVIAVRVRIGSLKAWHAVAIGIDRLEVDIIQMPQHSFILFVLPERFFWT